MASNPISKLNEEEYLAIERAAEFKSEFLDGEMFAMSGASNTHCRLQRNLLIAAHSAARERGCEAFGSDFRIKTAGPTYLYPDVSAVCDGPVTEGAEQDNLLNPVAIFEVLSPSSEKFDRGAKFQRYRTVPSLKGYILVSQDQVRVEQFTRGSDGTWTFRDYQRLDEELEIESIGISIPLARIYDQVEIDASRLPA